MDLVVSSPEAQQKFLVDEMALGQGRQGKRIPRPMTKLAILDDYQQLPQVCGLGTAARAAWRSRYSLRRSRQGRRGCEARAIRGPGADARAPFPRELIEKLPNLKFMALTGLRSASPDLTACSARAGEQHARARLPPRPNSVSF
jgi:hypothetical protein